MPLPPAHLRHNARALSPSAAHAHGRSTRLAGRALVAALVATLATGCSTVTEPEGPPMKETVLALTAQHELIRFNAGQPGRVLSRVALQGLAPGEQVLGIDFRVARGVLYALGGTGRLYTVNVANGRASALPGQAALALPLRGVQFGVDFNPAADRIRIVSDAGQNLRMHPDTGALVDADANRPGVQADADLAYAPGDVHAGRAPRLAAAGYTYNTQDGKLTTNYAIDTAAGTLVMQGSREGKLPAVSPNTGQLTTVGRLGVAADDAAFDIADVRNTALAALRIGGRTVLHQVDLASGAARRIGTVADGAALRGLAIEP